MEEDENEIKQSEAKEENDDKCGAGALRNNTTVVATKSGATKSTARKPVSLELAATQTVSTKRGATDQTTTMKPSLTKSVSRRAPRNNHQQKTAPIKPTETQHVNFAHSSNTTTPPAASTINPTSTTGPITTCLPPPPSPLRHTLGVLANVATTVGKALFGFSLSQGGVVGVSSSSESVTLSALTSTTKEATTEEYGEVYVVFAEDYNEEEDGGDSDKEGYEQEIHHDVIAWNS